jgi:hypothetical protein
MRPAKSGDTPDELKAVDGVGRSSAFSFTPKVKAPITEDSKSQDAMELSESRV